MAGARSMLAIKQGYLHIFKSLFHSTETCLLGCFLFFFNLWVRDGKGKIKVKSLV